MIDLTTPQRLHVVGVGGTGMNAVASVLVDMGHHVSGSDIKESVAVERVRARGVTVNIGHDPEVVEGVDAVITSTAVPDANSEIAAAHAREIPVMHRSEILGIIARLGRTVAVAGTHGKTTTSSMMALALRAAGWHTSFVIGGDVNEIGTGAGWDAGGVFVVEADESDGTFLKLGTSGIIVTSIEPDHLEHYGAGAQGWQALQVAFETFASGATGPRVICVDDDGAAALAARVDAVTYGTRADATYHIDEVAPGRSSIAFVVRTPAHGDISVALPLPGLHNARNATAVIAMALELGAPVSEVVDSLARFGGVARRFEFKGDVRGVNFIDDYAHIPGELHAALRAATDGAWQRIVAVFQPHRYSRTETLWPSFADAFVGADVVVLTDVYAAGEAPRPGVSGALLVHAILDAHPRTRVVYLPRRSDLAPFLAGELRAGDLCLTLGAGDITGVSGEVRALWERTEAAHVATASVGAPDGATVGGADRG